jgi:hypothetical protein
MRHPVQFVAVAFAGVAMTALADTFYVGPKACQECHKTEGGVWEQTKHATSFKDVHKAAKAKDILAAAGGDANMRKNATCTQCHFTMEQADASAAPLAKSAVSCEKCHGAGSDFIKIHNDFGGPDVKRENEKPEHKTKRLADSRAAGMFLPDSLYDIAANCMACHGLAKPGIDPGILAKMLEAGHPLDPDYELVRYSQGTVRHRFYPPDTDKNKEQTPAELARMFVTGQAAKLVSAAAAAKSDNAAYKAAQVKRAKDAAAALAAVKSVPEAAALVAAPTADNARKLTAAIAGKDLTAEVGSLLPAKDSYK